LKTVYTKLSDNTLLVVPFAFCKMLFCYVFTSTEKFSSVLCITEVNLLL